AGVCAVPATATGNVRMTECSLSVILERFLRDHHVRSTASHPPPPPRPQAGHPALTTDEGVITPTALLPQALVTPLRATWHAIPAFDQATAQRAQSPPACPFLAALPGAGAVFAPRLRVACGEQRHRYASADALHKYAGMAPVTARS